MLSKCNAVIVWISSGRSFPINVSLSLVNVYTDNTLCLCFLFYHTSDADAAIFVTMFIAGIYRIKLSLYKVALESMKTLIFVISKDLMLHHSLSTLISSFNPFALFYQT
jgi:hypothetical protein